jgi:phospholipase D1/2
VWDVFLLDSDFKIERPKRYYRQGLNLLHPDTHADDVDNMTLNVPVNDDNRSTMGTIGRRLSNLLRVGHHSRHENIGNGVSGTAHHESPHMSSNSLPFSAASRPPTPMLDPSTNINPLLSAEKGTNEPSDPMPILGENDKKKSQSGDVSKHTFYIENAQMRLKLFAHNEVGRDFV